MGREIIAHRLRLDVPDNAKAWAIEMMFTFGLLFVMHVSTPGRFTKEHGGVGVAMLIIGASFAAAGAWSGIPSWWRIVSRVFGHVCTSSI